MSAPISPAEYGSGMNDQELEAAGRAAGLDVWGPVKKAYSDFVGDMTLANSQLWSLREAIRAELLAERGLWPCGCLINAADAHRVGCPKHPQGQRGDR